MAEFHAKTATEQLADYLRSELIRCRWTGQLPGAGWLSRELGVGKNTMEGALAQLEAEGILIPQGAGRHRRIDLKGAQGVSALKIQILLYEESDRKLDFMIELICKLQQAGHVADFSGRTLLGLGMDLKRVSKYVADVEADAWVIVGGNGEVLEWFASRPQPAYALFGRQQSVGIGGSSTFRAPALIKALERLMELGHRRIVMMSRTERRKPNPGLFERCFLDTLTKHGIEASSYNLPDWEDGAVGFRRCLDALFALTPPTALLVDQPHSFLAAQQHLASRGIVAPQDVSMLCKDYDPVYQWSVPEVSHIRWDSKRLVRNATRWVGQVARGQDIRRQSLVEAEWVEGGTIGPANTLRTR